MRNRFLPSGFASPFRSLALCATALAAVSSSVEAQLDVNVYGLEVSQGFQNKMGTVPLVAGRSTFVRAQMRLIAPPVLPLPLDGILRVFVDGVESPASPIYSHNGPFPAPLISSLSIENGTLNFIFLPPESGDVVLTVEVNPPGPNFVAEANLANNTYSSPSLNFQARDVAEIAYAPIDYRPSGGPTPNLPDATLIEPGLGDNFIQAIFPTSDWFYHRIDAPSKLWTSSLSGSGVSLLNSLLADIVLMNPVPDILYGWVPGGLPYNGQSMINAPVSMGNTQTFKYQRTFAHEVGHNFGLFHINQQTDRNSIDVEHHLNLTEALPVVKGPNLNDIMVPGLNTNQAWVYQPNYLFFFNHPVLNPNSAPVMNTPAVFLSGVWNQAEGTLEVEHLFETPSIDIPASAPSTDGSLLVRAFGDGQLLSEQPIARLSISDSCAGSQSEEHAHEAGTDSELVSPLIAFEVRLPQGSTPIDSLVISAAGPLIGSPTALVIERSPAAPAVAFTSPAAAADTSASVNVPGVLNVAWEGSDADGDALLYYLRYSHNGTSFIPLATGTQATSLEVDLRKLPALVNGLGFFELRASDGLNTTVTRTPALTGNFFGVGGNAPWVEIMTPDNGKSYLFGATVILHSSGWDLEDRGLTGSSIQWSSDVDGALGSGRLLSVTTLSVGAHVLTVEATDSGGLIDIDTTMITILDRDLPDVGGDGAYCTAKLASAGCLAQIAGTGTASASSPNVFDLSCSEAINNKNGLLFYGLAAGDIPFLGGTLCITPPLSRTSIQNSGGNAGADDCSGSYSFDFNALIQSGNAPFLTQGTSVFAQYWYRDPADLVSAAALSNALSFTIQP